MEITPFVGLTGVVVGAAIAWRRAQLSQQTQHTFELYRYFYSGDFSKVRASARNFKGYLNKHQHLCAHYFIVIDIEDIPQSERQEYYDLITNYAGVLYFFSGLVEHLNAKSISKKSLIRLFRHVFEWWYLNSIRDFIVVYEDELQRVYDDHHASLAHVKLMTSKPPWVANLKTLSEIMQLDQWTSSKRRR